MGPDENAPHPAAPRDPKILVLLRYAIGLVGLALASTSACWTAAAGGEIVAGTGTTPPGILLGMFLFSVGLTLGGALVAKRALWPSRRRRPERLDREIKILAFVAASGGRVTVAEVAAHCLLAVAESREALERMASQGVAELLFTGEAVPVYVFPGLLTTMEKTSAGPLVLADGGPDRVPDSGDADRLADRLRRLDDAATSKGPDAIARPLRRDTKED
jgi:hypothetical protein